MVAIDDRHSDISRGRNITKLTDIAIVGAGPYGLSIAAHLAARGADFRIFGEPLNTWRKHMPQGMSLKSDGFASNLSSPEPGSTLADYCAERGLPYDDMNIPVPLDTFIAYGLDFQQRFVPMLERQGVTRVERSDNGYHLLLDDGEVVEARRVVLAIGITHFDDTPPMLAALPKGLVSHASAYAHMCAFKGRDVTVVGAGSSAVELSVHLHEAGARARMIARRPEIKFRAMQTGARTSRWQQIRHPKSGLGPGIRSMLCCDAPDLFRVLPGAVRLEIVRRHLGPSSPGYLREKIEGKVEILTSHSMTKVEAAGDRVRLHLSSDAGPVTVETDHVISATGYRADLKRLGFLDEGLRDSLRRVGDSPELSSGFESSAPGLYFVGNAAAASFGPLMRFMFGADFAARRVSRHLAKSAR